MNKDRFAAKCQVGILSCVPQENEKHRTEAYFSPKANANIRPLGKAFGATKYSLMRNLRSLIGL